MLKDNTDEVVVSVTLVTYNHEKFIEKAMRSILSQKTNYCYELIVGDDASTDKTPKIIKKIADEYPNIVVPVLREKNLGATRNGYDLWCRAKGKYIISCDGDDCWCDDNRIQEQVDFLETHPEYGGVCGRVRLIDETDSPLPDDIMGNSSFFVFERDEFTREDFEKWLMPGHVSAMMLRFDFAKKKKMKDVFLSHSTVGDRISVLYGLLMGNIYCTQNIVMCYRILNTGNFMTQYQKKNLRDEDVRMMQAIENFIHKECDGSFSLESIKKDRFVAAISIWLKKNTKRNRQVLWNIWSESDKKLIYSWILIKTIAIKLYYWYILHEDRKIEI
ncbi:Glycosyl transferase family 2 [Selenomonas ruminantium]|uniref:Glycosyl transferase family 2 n=2 Tax=Selenomonas ruminantium TaxID=971 RepID=A0A1M6W2J1_SELRU|nr:Glycosyl transferase family 2 [Selenomonas ruminantium]